MANSDVKSLYGDSSLIVRYDTRSAEVVILSDWNVLSCFVAIAAMIGITAVSSPSNLNRASDYDGMMEVRRSVAGVWLMWLFFGSIASAVLRPSMLSLFSIGSCAVGAADSLMRRMCSVYF